MPDVRCPTSALCLQLQAECCTVAIVSAETQETREIHIGEFIRQQRKQAEMSLRRLAERAGISNPYLSQIERGLRQPSAEILKALARGLSIQAESLYVRAGLLDAHAGTPGVTDAIKGDDTLSDKHKKMLLDLYRELSKSPSKEQGEQ